MEVEGEAGGPGQAAVLRAPPGPDGGGKQWGSLGAALLLVPEAEQARGLVAQQVVVPAIAEMKLPRVAVPVEAEVVEAPGVREEPGCFLGCREGGVDGEDFL